MLKLRNITCVAALAALVAPAFAAEWMTDFDAAKARAAAEGKSILMDFTGSDWCGWCIRLKKDVFDKADFSSYADENFVLMEVDVPNNPKFDPELLRRNRELCEQFQVDGFPSILVVTPAGEVVGGFVGGKAGFEEARKPLDAALANAAALKEAELLDGDEKLKALYAVYQNIPEELRAASTLRTRLAELDTANITGILDEIKAQQQMTDVVSRLRAAGQDTKAMLAVVDAALAEAYPKNRAALLQMKVSIQLMAAETEEDILAAKATLLQVAEADPENAAAIRAMAEQRFANPARLLNNIKMRRRK